MTDNSTYTSSKSRPQLIQHLAETHFDLVVIGGGITGCGIALDAATRGLKVALVEKLDFGSGTSSRSTKLIHGGLRYLKQFEIALVREVGRERATVHKLAPHLVIPEKMLLPIVEGGTFGKFMTSVGLMVYDVLAGVERADQREMLSREKTLEEEPLLEMDILKGSGFYAEYRTDDARLTVEVMKTAMKHGAACANYVEVTDFQYDENHKIEAVTCHDHLTNERFSIQANYIVSAAGPWVDDLREKDKSLTGKHLYLTKGVHLVVPREKLPLKHAVYFDVPDGRMIFAIPRQQITYIGTTDTPYHGDIDHVITEQEDAQYLLDAVNNFFPTMNLGTEDVVSSWAGLRPLIHEEGKSASEISRKDEIFESKNGLISIAGGKLTGYRKMAERIMEVVGQRMLKEKGQKIPKAQTRKTTLLGGEYGSFKAVKVHRAELAERLSGYGMGQAEANYFVANYGKQTERIISHFEAKDTNTAEELLLSELDFALNYEMIHTALDFLNRRTGRLYFDIESLRTYVHLVVDKMAEVLGWDESRKKAEIQSIETATYEASHFPAAVQQR